MQFQEGLRACGSGLLSLLRAERDLHGPRPTRASRSSAARAAARQFEVGDSTAIRWVQRWEETGSAAAVWFICKRRQTCHHEPV